MASFNQKARGVASAGDFHRAAARRWLSLPGIEAFPDFRQVLTEMAEKGDEWRKDNWERIRAAEASPEVRIFLIKSHALGLFGLATELESENARVRMAAQEALQKIEPAELIREVVLSASPDFLSSPGARLGEISPFFQEQASRQAAEELGKLHGLRCRDVEGLLDALKTPAEVTAFLKIWENQPQVVANFGEFSQLRTLALEGRAKEGKSLLRARCQSLERYWRIQLGITPGRPGRRRLPPDETKAYLCALGVQQCLARFRQVFETKRKIRGAHARAVGRNPSILVRYMMEAGCTDDEARLGSRLNSPLAAACELVADAQHVSPDTVARYYRAHRRPRLGGTRSPLQPRVM